MATYVIGDIQGCFIELKTLLKEISFDPHKDQLWCVGDLVNRGPLSLEVLLHLQQYGDAVKIILGNHDLYLLGVYYEAWPATPSATLLPILQYDDAEMLMDWLRNQPLVFHSDDKKHWMIHAGLYPLWTLEEAKEYAHIVEKHLRSHNPYPVLAAMYGNKPNRWSDDLKGDERTRFIINALTRMRYVDQEARLDLHCKESPDDAPENLMPWYEHPRLLIPDDVTLYFGHWASLNIQKPKDNIIALDTGCVWGEHLTAYRIDDGQFFSVKSQQRD